MTKLTQYTMPPPAVAGHAQTLCQHTQHASQHAPCRPGGICPYHYRGDLLGRVQDTPTNHPKHTHTNTRKHTLCNTNTNKPARTRASSQYTPIAAAYRQNSGAPWYH